MRNLVLCPLSNNPLACSGRSYTGNDAFKFKSRNYMVLFTWLLQFVYAKLVLFFLISDSYHAMFQRLLTS